MLDIVNLSKNYKRKRALKGVSVEVDSGEIVALIGKNGAGKTTLLNCIAGNITPTTGEIMYKGENLLREDSRLSEFGILIEAKFFEYLDAQANLALLMEASGYKDKRAILEKVNATLALVGLSEEGHSYVKSFSFGMKQRLGLAQALLHDPNFLILDEPFVGLDPIGKEMLKTVILDKARKGGAGVIFSNHDLYDVSEICDRIVMLKDGEKIYDDIFLYKKTYLIFVAESVSGDMSQMLTSQFKGKVSVSADIISFVDGALLNAVMNYLVSHDVPIRDMQIKENSLYDFFKGDVVL